MTTYVVYVVVGWIAAAVLCAYIASEKNRSGGSWFFAGLVFGLFAVIAIVAVPALSKEEREQRERDAKGEEDPELEEWRKKMKRKL